MNTYPKFLLTFVLLLGLGFGLGQVSAQTPKKQEIQILTNSICGGCKGTLEGAVKQEKGIIYAYHDTETKILTVKFKTKKISAEEIRKAVTLAGYDADDMKADPSARGKLDECCKAPE